VPVQHIDVRIRLERRSRSRHRPLPQPVRILREDDVVLAQAFVGQTHPEAIAPVLGRRSALQTADLRDPALRPPVLGAPLGRVLPGPAPDRHVVRPDEHRVVRVHQVAVQHDHRHAALPRLLDDLVQRRRFVRRDDQQVDPLREQVLHIAHLLGIVLRRILEQDLELRICRRSRRDLAVHRLAPGLRLVRLRHADHVLVFRLREGASRGQWTLSPRIYLHRTASQHVLSIRLPASIVLGRRLLRHRWNQRNHDDQHGQYAEKGSLVHGIHLLRNLQMAEAGGSNPCLSYRPHAPPLSRTIQPPEDGIAAKQQHPRLSDL